jgi:tetratricopeptide (TPR) repeat protein
VWIGHLVISKLNEFRDGQSVSFLSMQHRIAARLLRMGLLDEAMHMAMENLTLRLHKYGIGSWHISPALELIAALYHKMNRLEEALKFYSEELQIVEKVYGKSHAETLNVLTSIGNVYRSSGTTRHAETLATFQRCAEIGEALYGLDNINLPPIYNMLAIALANVEKYDEALKYFQRAISISTMVFGEEHPSIKTFQDNMKAIAAKRAESKKTTTLRDAIKAEKQKSSSNSKSEESSNGKAEEKD